MLMFLSLCTDRVFGDPLANRFRYKLTAVCGSKRAESRRCAKHFVILLEAMRSQLSWPLSNAAPGCKLQGANRSL